MEQEKLKHTDKFIIKFQAPTLAINKSNINVSKCKNKELITIIFLNINIIFIENISED